MLADKVKQLKAEKRERNRQVREATAKEEAPKVEKITAIWQRIASARTAAGKTMKEIARLTMNYVSDTTIRDFEGYEAGTKKIRENSTLPFGYSVCLSDIERFVAVADALGVSLDYLFCRTDDPEVHHGQTV